MNPKCHGEGNHELQHHRKGLVTLGASVWYPSRWVCGEGRWTEKLKVADMRFDRNAYDRDAEGRKGLRRKMND